MAIQHLDATPVDIGRPRPLRPAIRGSRKLFALAARLLRSVAGTSAIEFAFVAPFLALLTLGILDFGIGFWEDVQVGNAARAGAEFAVKYTASNGFDPTSISTAVKNATSLSVQANPAPSEGCFCPNSNGLTAMTCNAGCGGGGTAATYVTVNARATYSTIFAWPGLTNPITLSSSATVRIN